MALTWITRRTPRRALLALPLLLSACAGTVCSNGTAQSYFDAVIPPGCAVTETSGGVGVLSCEDDREGFAFSTPPAFQTMGDTQ